MKTLFKNEYKTYHHKAIKSINKWLADNCIKIDNHNFMDGIGYYREYTVFPLADGKYCIVLSIDRPHELKQKIVQLTDTQVKNIDIHNWLKNVITR
jgi:hypothetical protein